MQNLKQLHDNLTRIRETNRPISEQFITAALIQLTRAIQELQPFTGETIDAKKD